MSQLKKSQDTFGIKLLYKTAVKVATINLRENIYSVNTVNLQVPFTLEEFLSFFYDM